MKAQFENDRSPIWFFASTDNELVKSLPRRTCAIATFASKGHDLFATLHGTLSLDNDPVTIDRFWNRYVAAWFEGGKDDPKLALLRLDADHAEIWLDEGVSLPVSSSCSAQIPKKNTRTKSPKSAFADAPARPGAGPLSR